MRKLPFSRRLRLLTSLFILSCPPVLAQSPSYQIDSTVTVSPEGDTVIQYQIREVDFGRHLVTPRQDRPRTDALGRTTTWSGFDKFGNPASTTDHKGRTTSFTYDAWGRLRDPQTLAIYPRGQEPYLLLGRGFTGHEHLPLFSLVNMNARLYDPLLGRFLYPDPYIQDPGFSQNYNRYAYVLNNPLKKRIITEFQKTTLSMKRKKLFFILFIALACLSFVSCHRKPQYSAELKQTAPAFCAGAQKKLIAMDLDGTLTEHRTPMDSIHRATLDQLGKKYKLLMVGGGNATRIHTQMGDYPIEILGNYGMSHGKVVDGVWQIVDEVRVPVDTAFFLEKSQYFRDKYGYTKYYGDPVEFHPSGMVTFGLLGTAAPKEEKLAFDVDKKKRQAMFPEVCEVFKDYAVFIGGSTSFDFAPKEYNKYDALVRYAREHGYAQDEILFFGDDMTDGGNDSHIRLGGLDYVWVHDYRDFPELAAILLP